MTRLLTIIALLLTSCAHAAPPIIDGGELYGLRTLSDFGLSYLQRKFIPLADSRWSPCSIGFGVYVDMETDPAALSSKLTNALNRADDVVWLYSEKLQYLFPPTDPHGQPQAWIDAVRAAKKSATKPTKLILFNCTSIANDHFPNDPTSLAKTFAYLDSLPFDGIVTWVSDSVEPYDKAISYNLLRPTPINYGDMLRTLAPLAGLQPKNLKTNFAQCYLIFAPDAFEDWSVSLANVASLARACKACGIAGICIDNEDYGSSWAAYPSKRSKPGKSFSDYEVAMFARGQQVAKAIRSEYPECLVMLTVSPTSAIVRNPEAKGHELNGAFFSGMVDVK